MQERRKFIRRQADRDLLQRYQALYDRIQQLETMANADESRELRHKRRRTIRHLCHVRIGLPIGFQSGRDDIWTVEQLPIKGRLLDLSAEGCALFTHQTFDIGQSVNLNIEVSGGRHIKATGIVRWTKQLPEKGGYATGVQFNRMGEDDQKILHYFLDELDRTIGL
ncbi:MAG TPA: PilZ domain-containing protein [Candidatus Hydrogenedens sp.]|mgnify:CR=1 FL=1|nr:PilZ domain-containing protein [Candidatus Hydrogenedens sp.]